MRVQEGKPDRAPHYDPTRKDSQLRRDTWKTLEKREPCGPIEWTKNAKSPPVRAESGHFYEEHMTSFAI